MARRAKIGFMALCAPIHVSRVDDLGRPFPVVGLAEMACRKLVEEGYEVIRYSEQGLVQGPVKDYQVSNFEKDGIVDSRKKAFKAMEKFRSNNVDCIVLYPISWVWAGHYTQALRDARIPLILWSAPVGEGCSMTGLLGMHGTLNQIGIEHKLVYGMPEDSEALKEIETYAQAAMVVNKLKRSKYGQIGGKCMDMIPSVLDNDDWLVGFGIETEHIDQYSLVKEGEKFGKNEIDKVYKRIKKMVGEITPLDEPTERCIRIYLAHKKLIQTHELDFTSLKCVFDLSDNYVSPCLAQSLISEEGFVSACCSDDMGALTMYIMSLLSPAPIFQADVEVVDYKTGVLRMISCGAAPFSLARSKEDVSACSRIGLESQAGGVQIDLVAKPGRVTVARLSRLKSDYTFHITEGEAFMDDPKKRKECGFPTLPHAFVKLKADPKRFVQNCGSHFTHICYADLKEKLLEVCRLLGIKPLLD